MSKQKTPANLELNDESKQPQRRTVDKHRQCPRCYEGEMNGVGLVYNTNGKTQYRKCDQCGHTWTTVIKDDVTIIRNREVDVVERRA